MDYSLRELKDDSRKIYNRLRWSIGPVATNLDASHLTNADVLREVVEDIEKFGLFKAQVDILKASSLFKLPGDIIRISKAEGDTINETLKLLDALLDNFHDILEVVIPEESESSINIKLPPVNDFNDLSLYARDLHLALTQVLYLEDIAGGLKIESVENGSIWLNVLLYGTASVSLVGSLVWSAAVIYKKILEGKMMAEQLRALKIRGDSMEDVLTAQKESLLQLVQSEADYISSSSFQQNIPENIERIKGSIRLFADLLDKGAEIHPAIGAPEEVANLYPNMKTLPTLESKTKQLSA
jgi:hypothetical protein